MRALHLLAGITLVGTLACGGETGPGGDQFVLDAGRAVTSLIGPDGGTLQAIDARGRSYRLVIPPLALAEEVEITVTPVATFPPLGGTVEVLAAAHFAPEGLAFAFPASLTITGLDAGVASRPSGFSYRGNGVEPVVVVSGGTGGTLHAQVSHFSGVGAVADVLQLEPDAPLAGAAAAFSTIASTAYGTDWSAGSWEASYGQIVASLEAWYHGIVAPALNAADTDQELTNAVAGWSAWQHVIDCGADTCSVESGNLHLWTANVGFLIKQALADLQAAATGTAAAAVVRGAERSIATCRASRDLEAAVKSVYWSGAAIVLGGDPPDDPVAQCVTLELYEFEFPATVEPGVPAELSLVAGLSFADAPSTHEHFLTVQVEASDALPTVGGGNTALGSGRFRQAYTPDGDASVVLGVRIFLGHPGLEETLRIDTLIDRPLGIAVTLTPTAAILDPGAEAQFVAEVSGTTSTAVTWTATGGTISVSGSNATYAAGSTPGEYAVTATSVADPSRSATATVTIVGGGSGGSVTLEGSPQLGTTATLSFTNARNAPACQDSKPDDEVEVDPPLSLSVSAQCSANAVSDSGAAMSGHFTAGLTYAFEVVGGGLRSFTASGQAGGAAQGEGEGLGDNLTSGKVIGGSSSRIGFEFEVLDSEAEIVLTGQLASSISTAAANVGAFASVRLRSSSGEQFYAKAGRTNPADATEPDVEINQSLRLPPGIYDVLVETTTAANTYRFEPRAEGSANFSITLTISP